MNRLLATLSCLALAALIGAAIAYTSGALTLDTAWHWFTFATVGWFAAASPWLGRRTKQ